LENTDEVIEIAMKITDNNEGTMKIKKGRLGSENGDAGRDLIEDVGRQGKGGVGHKQTEDGENCGHRTRLGHLEDQEVG
jgi:hypothetical protein